MLGAACASEECITFFQSVVAGIIQVQTTSFPFHSLRTVNASNEKIVQRLNDKTTHILISKQADYCFLNIPG